MMEKALIALGATGWVIKGESVYKNIQWKDGLALFTEEEVNAKIIELENQVAQRPNWQYLAGTLELYFNIGYAFNDGIFNQCFNMLIALLPTPKFDANSLVWRNFAFNLNLGKGAFTSEQIKEIETIFKTANVPFTFDA